MSITSLPVFAQDPSNLFYNGFWHTCSKASEDNPLAFTDGGFDYTDKLSDTVNNFIMPALSELGEEEHGVESGYGWNNYAEMCIENYGKYLVFPLNFRKNYRGTNTPIIMNECFENHG